MYKRYFYKNVKDKYEKKYGIKEIKRVAFHKSRRMFCIKNGNIVIANMGVPYSHAVWFETLGWMGDTNDSFMNKIVRGMVDKAGNIFFYKGYEFIVDEHTEGTFFYHLRQLARTLKLRPTSNIFGGLKKNGQQYIPRKYYGTLRRNMSNTK
jgi:hypothetical protein